MIWCVEDDAAIRDIEMYALQSTGFTAKKVEIIEAEACADHIHMLVSIPPHLSVAQFMGYLKGKAH